MSEPSRIAVAEFDNPEQLLVAVRALRQEGFTRMDACTPFPVHGLDQALGARRAPLGWLVLGAGLFGAAAALLLQWWTGAVSYPLVIGGKPLFAWEFAVPVTFELAVLLGAFAAFFGMLAFNKLPQYYHPVFEYSGFQRVTTDRFLLVVDTADPRFHATSTPQRLEQLGAIRVELVGEAS